MDAQEIFNKVATHLFTQGSPSLTLNGCAYRGDGGNKCAAGPLIPDKIYRSGMEGLNVEDLARDWKPLRELWGNNVDLIQDLQFLHDGVTNLELTGTDESRSRTWGSTEAMRAALATVAATHDLNASVLDTLHFEDR